MLGDFGKQTLLWVACGSICLVTYSPAAQSASTGRPAAMLGANHQPMSPPCSHATRQRCVMCTIWRTSGGTRINRSCRLAWLADGGHRGWWLALNSPISWWILECALQRSASLLTSRCAVTRTNASIRNHRQYIHRNITQNMTQTLQKTLHKHYTRKHYTTYTSKTLHRKHHIHPS